MSGGMDFFADFVNSQGLRDVPISGASFTWSSMQTTPSLSKLDIFLLSSEWDSSFPFSKGLVRPQPTSDHFPIVLCGKLLKGDPKPFKIDNIWLCSPDFMEMVRRCWNSFMVTGKLGQKLRLKLKLLRDNLRVWNREVFGRVDLKERKKKKQLLEEIHFWDQTKEHYVFSNMERQMKDMAKQDYAKFSTYEEIK